MSFSEMLHDNLTAEFCTVLGWMSSPHNSAVTVLLSKKTVNWEVGRKCSATRKIPAWKGCFHR